MDCDHVAEMKPVPCPDPEAEWAERNLMATILRNMAEGVCLVRAADSRILYANPKFELMFGYDNGELFNQPVACLNEQEGSEAPRESARDLMARIQENETLSYEIRIIRKDRTPFWCRATTSCFNHPTHGRVFVAVHEDITAGKRAAENLKESELRYQSLVESAYDSIIVVDTEGAVVLANAATQKIFGYSPSELIGENIDILVPERFRSRHFADLSRYAAHPRARPMGAGLELYGRRKDGSEFPADISLSPIEVSGGRQRFIAVVRDITQLKKTETELIELLRKTQEAVRTREDVLAIVSHDLKNPLFSIQLSAELISRRFTKEGVTSEAITRFVEAITRSAKQMQRLISDLLDFAKIQSGAFALELGEERLGPIVRSAVEAMSPLAAAKSIEIALEDDPSLPTLICDKDRVSQILFNLLGNAVKFTPERGKITVRVRNAGKEAIISVRDTGPGIDPGLLPAVFERYSQASETARLGTGLGLSIAKGITEAHHGRIWAESALGQGSQFSFALPLESRATGHAA